MPLKNSFQMSVDTYAYNTRAAACQYKIVLPKVRTQNYGLFSVRYRSAALWNEIVDKFPGEKFHLQSIKVCKEKITKFFIDGYDKH